jgi:hypothetical protein
MERARETVEGRKTSTLVQSRSRTVQPIPDLASPVRIPKKFPDRTAPHPHRRSFPTPEGHYHPGRAPSTPNRPPLTLLGLHRGNIYVGRHIQIHLQWARAVLVLHPRHRCDVSIPLQGSVLLAQRESAVVTLTTPLPSAVSRSLPIRTCSNTSASTFTTFELPFSPPTSFS